MAIRALRLLAVVALLATTAFLCVRFTASGRVRAEGWGGARTTNGIAPRWTSLEQITARLGRPDAVDTYGASLERVRYRVPAQGIADLTLWLDEERYVRWARIVPTGPLTVAEVERVVKGFSARTDAEPGDLLRYARGFLRVVDGAVKEIWIVDEAISPRTMQREM